MKIVAIIQARVASTRLPAKVLMDLQGQPAIIRVWERVQQSKLIHELCIATTDDPSDTPLAQLLEQRGLPYFRGSHHDVLDRFYQTAKKCQADVVVRLTGDCPLHDAQVIDQVIQAHLDAQDKPVYTSNVHPPTFPDGLDVEVFPFSALEEAIHSARDKHSREHVGPAIYKHYITDPALKPRTLNVAYPTDFSHLRWTLDTPEDYTFLNTVYEHLLASRPDFTWLDVVALLTRCPWMLKINADLERNFTVAQLKQDRQMALEKDRPQ